MLGGQVIDNLCSVSITGSCIYITVFVFKKFCVVVFGCSCCDRHAFVGSTVFSWTTRTHRCMAYELHLSISDIVRLSNRWKQCAMCWKFIGTMMHSHALSPNLGVANAYFDKMTWTILRQFYVQNLGYSWMSYRTSSVRSETLKYQLQPSRRTLNHITITHKSISKETAERNEHLHATCRLPWHSMILSSLSLLTEAGVDDQTNLPRYGWAPFGQACVRCTSFLRGRKYSILPALSVDGIVALDILRVSESGTLSDFSSQPSCMTLFWYQSSSAYPLNQHTVESFPMDHSVVVMDNCSIHHDEDIHQIIEDKCGKHLVLD